MFCFVNGLRVSLLVFCFVNGFRVSLLMFCFVNGPRVSLLMLCCVAEEERIVSEERAKFQALKDELRDKTHRVNELEVLSRYHSCRVLL